MRRLSILITLLAICAISLLSMQVGSASADGEGDCDRLDPTTGECVVEVTPPPPAGSPGDPVDYPQPGQSGDNAPACVSDGSNLVTVGPVDCKSDFGYWNNTHQCYIAVAQPQPPAGDPVWEGHEPGDGVIYACQVYAFSVTTFWAANPPDGPAAGPTPAEVARGAIARLRLKAIDIGIVPEPGPDRVGVVGMPTWMWVNDPSSRTYGPVTISASAGAITVRLTAKVERIVWDMGDGTKVPCTTAGTPYEDRFGKASSPDCGHRYEKTSADEPDGRYSVTAQSYWPVDWEGAGQSGTIRLPALERTVDIEVGELQVLTQ